ncbi:MAG: hypothetical protein CL940_03160 [Deltaproteobacteria bacterium]|nr:hypothetical protein [Deltaproteobacteria bacterium]
MSHDEKRDELAPVVSLECARIADALAEGTIGPEHEEHLNHCADCAALVMEMDSVTSLLAEATAPVTPPRDFASRVLDRANTLTLDLDSDPYEDATKERGANARWPALAALASIAAVALAFWAGGMQAKLEAPERAAPAANQVAVAPAAPVAPATSSPTTVDRAEVTLRQAGGAELAPEPVQPAVVPEPAAIPEPSLDIPSEIQAALLQVIEDNDGCPKTSGGSVRITATVEPTGAIVDRQIVSSGDVTQAHRCVTEALDGLKLPPLAQRARVTLDLRW